MATKWPQRQNLTSEFKSMAKVTYYSMLILPVLAFLWPDFQLRRRRLRPPRRRKLQDVDLLPQVKMGSLFMSQEDRIKTKSEAKTEAKKNLLNCHPAPVVPRVVGDDASPGVAGQGLADRAPVAAARGKADLQPISN